MYNPFTVNSFYFFCGRPIFIFSRFRAFRALATRQLLGVVYTGIRNRRLQFFYFIRQMAAPHGHVDCNTED